MTENTAKLLGTDFILKPRGEIEIKGGVKVNAFVHVPELTEPEIKSPISAASFPHSTSTKSVVSLVSETPSFQIRGWRKLVAGIADEPESET